MNRWLRGADLRWGEGARPARVRPAPRLANGSRGSSKAPARRLARASQSGAPPLVAAPHLRQCSPKPQPKFMEGFFLRSDMPCAQEPFGGASYTSPTLIGRNGRRGTPPSGARFMGSHHDFYDQYLLINPPRSRIGAIDQSVLLAACRQNGGASRKVFSMSELPTDRLEAGPTTRSHCRFGVISHRSRAES